MNKEAKALNKANGEREKLILKENDSDYTNMIAYIRGANISEYNQELVRSDLIELILDGQERGDNIGEIIGENYKEICDEIIDSLPQRTAKEKLMSQIDAIMLSLAPLLVIKLIFTSISNFIDGKSLMNIPFTYADILNGFLIILVATLIVNYIIKNSFEIDNENKLSIFIKFFIFMSIFIGITVTVYIYLNITFITLPIWLVLIMLIATFLISKRLDN